eukprot:7268533-Pyramimonas_sp.AAC.1
MINLLTKKGFFTSGSIADLRPVTLLPVIYKWYSHALLLLLSPEQRQHSKYQFEFRNDFQAEEVVFIFQQLFEKCN